jgi:Tfp pilus assembly protein FimT
VRTPTHRHRPGLTLVELLVVLALLIILAAVTLPSFSGLRGNTDQQAAADLVRARVADARGRAMEFGTVYRLAVSADGTRLRLAPDGDDFASAPVDNPPAGASRASEDTLERATASVTTETTDPEAVSAPSAGAGGWMTVATFLPDGTCRECNMLVQVSETGFPPITIRVRGITGDARIVRPDEVHAHGGMQK